MAFKDVTCLPGHLGQVSYDSWVPCTETGGKVVLGMGLSSCWYIALHYWIGLGMLVSKLGLNLDCQNSTFLLAQSNISKMLFLMSGSSKVAKAFCQREGFRDGPFLDSCCLSAAPCLISCSGTRQRIVTRLPLPRAAQKYRSRLCHVIRDTRYVWAAITQP